MRENTCNKAVDTMFDLLDDWRHLPAYQLERRADIFFALYLRDIISHKYGADVKAIIPEFPIKKEGMYKSVKVDYLVQLMNDDVVLVELKTDARSKRLKQDTYLMKAQRDGMKKLVQDVLDISNVSTATRKYQHLLKKMTECGWISGNVKPENNIAEQLKMKVLYIMPAKDPNCDVVDFPEVISVLQPLVKQRKDLVAKRFCESLEKWI